VCPKHNSGGVAAINHRLQAVILTEYRGAAKDAQSLQHEQSRKIATFRIIHSSSTRITLAETRNGTYLFKAIRLTASLLTKTCSMFLLPGMKVHVDFVRHRWCFAMPNLHVLLVGTPTDLCRPMCILQRTFRRSESTMDLPFAIF
jgi:hypothetical protein